MRDDRLYVMAPDEILWGYLPGLGEPLPAPHEVAATPREALESVVRRALERPPCGVAFSGGRDSSLLLALAAHIARREGLAEPIALTNVFPNAPAADEDSWQELVVRHLGVREWCRIAVVDQLDLIGARAQAHLLEHGVVWPPTIHADGIFLDQLTGGSLIDGEGGDEVLGVRKHRIAPINGLVRSPRPLRWRRVRAASAALAPAIARRELARRQWSQQPIAWLRPSAREGLGRALGVLEPENKPLSFAASVRLVPQLRALQLLQHNRRILGRRFRVDVSSPLLDADVVHALARDGGWLGRGTRTAVLRSIAADLLPDAVLSRTSKADMRGGYMAAPTREFAEQWDGSGVDGELVDIDELRRMWLADEAAAATGALLQSAWLSTAGTRAMRPVTNP